MFIFFGLIASLPVLANSLTCQSLFQDSLSSHFPGRYSESEIKLHDLNFAAEYDYYVSGFSADGHKVFSQVRRVPHDPIKARQSGTTTVTLTDSEFDLIDHESRGGRIATITPNQLINPPGQDIQIWRKIDNIGPGSAIGELIRDWRGITPARRLPRALNRYVNSNVEVHVVYDVWDGTMTVNDRMKSPPYLQNRELVRARGKLNKVNGEFFLDSRSIVGMIPEYISDYHFEVYEPIRPPRGFMTRDKMLYQKSALVPKSKWVTDGSLPFRYEKHVEEINRFANLVAQNSRYTMAIQLRTVESGYRIVTRDGNVQFTRRENLLKLNHPEMNGKFFASREHHKAWEPPVSDPTLVNPNLFQYVRGAFLLKKVKSLDRVYFTTLRLTTTESRHKKHLFEALSPYLDGKHLVEVRYTTSDNREDSNFGVLDAMTSGHRISSIEVKEFKGGLDPEINRGSTIFSSIKNVVSLTIYKLEDASVLDLDQLPL